MDLIKVQEVIKKFKNKEAIIGIVGLGYVGLPLAICYEEAGYNVVGFDIDQSKIDSLMTGKTYINHIKDSSIESMVKSGFKATTDMSKISEVDAIIICVPTPLNKYREPDLSYVLTTLDSALDHLKMGQVISLESTTYPGTTEEEIVPRVESKGFVIGENFYVVYSPEREDPGNKHFNTKTIPKVLGGHTESCKSVGISMYEGIIDKVVPVSSTKTAEMVKLLENIHRSVNIGLVNEMKKITSKMDIDIHEVISAAASKPFGFTAYYPGPGVGGHCIPIDPFYLTWKAREYGLNTRFIELAGEVNNSMQEYVVEKIAEGLNLHKKSLKSSKVLILGIAYKKNVDDARESPPIQIMELLRDKGVNLSYSDPYLPVFPKMREHKFELNSIEINSDNLQGFDCVVLATDHDSFDYKLIEEHSKLIIDTRGRFSFNTANVIKA